MLEKRITAVIRQLFLMLLLSPFLFYLSQCAKVVSPTGGDKDTIPPAVRKSTPPNFSTGFASDEIEVVFDEFIQLKDVNQKLIVSPPMEKKPDVRLRGKGILIRLDEDLLPQTTYTLNFNDAISDNNEGNPLEGFEYVFSTGDELDSLSLAGTLVDAFSGKPVEGVYVMLYENLADSIPYLHVPYYLGKTDKEGAFSINHLRADTFRLFALQDLNMNYKFDQVTEAIAFLDSLITLRPETAYFSDSLSVDTSGIQDRPSDIPFYHLRLFVEKFVPAQYISSNNRPLKNQLLIVFGKSLEALPEISSPTESGDSLWYVQELSPRKDSLVLWVRDSLLMKQEEIELPLRYLSEDSAGQAMWVSDTLSFRFSSTQKGRRNQPVEEPTLPPFRLKAVTGNKSILDLNRPIILEAAFPVVRTDTSQVRLWQEVDSARQEVPYVFEQDSFRKRVFRIRGEWQPDTRYFLDVFPGAFTGYLGGSNDTLLLEVNTRKEDYYGTLYMNITGVSSPVIIQMLGKDDKVLNEREIETDTRLEYPFLPPEKIRFRAILDINRNGQWDTGKYLEKIQPEPVDFYQDEINIRSNWELELSWDLSFD